MKHHNYLYDFDLMPELDSDLSLLNAPKIISSLSAPAPAWVQGAQSLIIQLDTQYKLTTLPLTEPVVHDRWRSGCFAFCENTLGKDYMCFNQPMLFCLEYLSRRSRIIHLDKLYDWLGNLLCEYQFFREVAATHCTHSIASRCLSSRSQLKTYIPSDEMTG